MVMQMRLVAIINMFFIVSVTPFVSVAPLTMHSMHYRTLEIKVTANFVLFYPVLLLWRLFVKPRMSMRTKTNFSSPLC